MIEMQTSITNKRSKNFRELYCKWYAVYLHHFFFPNNKMDSYVLFLVVEFMPRDCWSIGRSIPYI